MSDRNLHFLRFRDFPNLFVFFLFFFFLFLFIAGAFVSPLESFAQTYNPAPSVQTQYFAQPAPNNNYLKNSQAFRQEIMRMEINVVRGAKSLPITQVPRVEKGDIIKMKLSEEAVGGIKPDQSMYDWTFLVAFINPNRRLTNEKASVYSDSTTTAAADNISGAKLVKANYSSSTATAANTTADGNPATEKIIKKTDTDSSAGSGESVSKEVNFRKSGWYREYSFVVPYDSQPVFFLYPKPEYRSKILKFVSKNYNEVRKLGEKTIELAGAYAQINSFLNELQYVLYQTQSSRYGTNTYFYNQGNPQFQLNGGVNGSNNSYTPYNPYNPYGGYNSSNPYYPYNPNNPNNTAKPDIPFNYNAFVEQAVERLARSFNIQLPQCWGNGSSYGGGYNSYGGGSNYGNYGSYGGYSSYGGYGSGTYDSRQNFGYGISQDLIARAQCVSRNIRLEDFDFSVANLLKQGGILAATQLRDKYPQIAYWISIASVAIEFIVRIFQKSPLRIVPTIVQSSDGFSGGGGSGSGGYGNMGSGGYGNSYQNPYPSNSSSPPNSQQQQQPVKISVYAENQPDTQGAVTAYPIVTHKWQAEPDPEVISLYPPVLSEPCLHAGMNFLKSTAIGENPESDIYSRNYRLVMSSANGFKKEFPVKKNVGMGGWELNLTSEDLNQIPKIGMTLEGELVGERGFNEIRSPKFDVPLPASAGGWQVKPEAQSGFAAGGKRLVTLRNTLGSCRCLQRVIYKPSFGGQFVFEASAGPNAANGLQFSADGREVSFEIDATYFQPGQGTLEIVSYGGDTQSVQQSAQGNNLPLKLYPAPPVISDVAARRGDREVLLTGERLEQLQWVTINGRRALIKGQRSQASNEPGNGNTGATGYPSAGSNPYQNLPNSAPTPAVAKTQPEQYKTAGQNQRVARFEESAARIDSNSISLELGLDDNRTFQYPQKFQVGIARPAIKANDYNEIEGVFNPGGLSEVKSTVQNPASNQKPSAKPENRKARDNGLLSAVSHYPAVSIDRTGMLLMVQNVITDYDFKNENLSVEAGIENAAFSPGELPQVAFEVLDTNNLRLNFAFNPSTMRALAGRRLQFRIRDRERGDSDWYTIRQTFVRLPEIESVRCAGGANGDCEMKGEGLEYIAQVSTDGGRSWFPQPGGGQFQIQPTVDGKYAMTIPFLINPKFLQIKLRDYPNTEGLQVTNFSFSSIGSRKFTTKENLLTDESMMQNQGQMPNAVPNQIQNQPQPTRTRQSSDVRKRRKRS